jgi:hypothetical protein
MSSEKKVDITGINDFDELLNMVRLDANLVDDLTDDQVTELRKKMNPYGRTIEGSNKLTCLSITNLSENYQKKFLMTSLIGFLYRQCDEHELDDGEPTAPMDNFAEYMEKYDSAVSDATESVRWLSDFAEAREGKEDGLSMEDTANRLAHRRRVERGEGFKRRLIVRQFLDTLFQYNPDLHVRSSYSDNPLDPERVKPAHITSKAANAKKTKTIVGKSGATMQVGGAEPAADEPAADEPGAEPVDEGLTEEEEKRANSKFVQHVPPADTFHRWTYYTDVNYEEIRDAVNDLFCEKPDLEFAINPYEQFDGDTADEKAKKFVQKHKNEVIADVLTLTNGKWNLTGSFKENRDRINFYNEKTAVLEEIFKQNEGDKKLGADLMRKRVKRKKKKNVEEAGPDPTALANYKKDHPSAVKNLGAEDVLGDNTLDESKDDVSFKVHEDCPYDAVQVDVFDFRKGGQSVKKSEFFTQAEDPKEIGGPGVEKKE